MDENWEDLIIDIEVDETLIDIGIEEEESTDCWIPIRRSNSDKPRIEDISKGIRLGVSSRGVSKKFQWSFELYDKTNNETICEEIFVKIDKRPNISIQEMNTKWIPMKNSWESMVITFIDINDAKLINLYKWVKESYGIDGQQNLNTNSDVDGKLKLHDSFGNMLEEWTLRKVFVEALNFGDLDFAATNPFIELTIRYSDVEYINKTSTYQI